MVAAVLKTDNSTKDEKKVPELAKTNVTNSQPKKVEQAKKPAMNETKKELTGLAKSSLIASMPADELSGKAENRQVLSEVLGGISNDDGEDLLNNFVDSTISNQEHETNTWLSEDVESTPTEDDQ